MRHAAALKSAFHHAPHETSFSWHVFSVIPLYSERYSLTHKSRNILVVSSLILIAGKGVKSNVKNFINNVYLSIKLLQCLVYWCRAYNIGFKKSYHWVSFSKPFHRYSVQKSIMAQFWPHMRTMRLNILKNK